MEQKKADKSAAAAEKKLLVCLWLRRADTLHSADTLCGVRGVWLQPGRDKQCVNSTKNSQQCNKIKAGVIMGYGLRLGLLLKKKKEKITRALINRWCNAPLCKHDKWPKSNTPREV